MAKLLNLGNYRLIYLLIKNVAIHIANHVANRVAIDKDEWCVLTTNCMDDSCYMKGKDLMKY